MRRQAGFSYVVVMFLVAVLSVAAVRALENTLTRERRDKEAELLWRGMAYREAIRMYYNSSPGNKSYPQELKDLLYDARLVVPRRYLRKLFSDPVANSPEWGVVRNADGTVVGVYSLSSSTPIKRSGFDPALPGFVNAQHYSDWKFVYIEDKG